MFKSVKNYQKEKLSLILMSLDCELGNDLINMRPKVQRTQVKNKQIRHHQINNPCLTKDTLRK